MCVRISGLVDIVRVCVCVCVCVSLSRSLAIDDVKSGKEPGSASWGKEGESKPARGVTLLRAKAKAESSSSRAKRQRVQGWSCRRVQEGDAAPEAAS